MSSQSTPGGKLCHWCDDERISLLDNQDFMFQGCLTFPDRSFYDGMWHYGKRSGLGTLCYSNGDLFQGAWRDDLMHGRVRILNIEYSCITWFILGSLFILFLISQFGLGYILQFLIMLVLSHLFIGDMHHVRKFLLGSCLPLLTKLSCKLLSFMYLLCSLG